MTPLDALYRCQRAWEATQPQLFMELWPDDGLDEPQPSALRFVEPAVSSLIPPGGGLTAGAEPRCDTSRGLTAHPPVTAAPALSGASAPLPNTTGPDAPPAEGARPAQEVTA